MREEQAYSRTLAGVLREFVLGFYRVLRSKLGGSLGVESTNSDRRNIFLKKVVDIPFQ
jgi:hypothetical protein